MTEYCLTNLGKFKTSYSVIALFDNNSFVSLSSSFENIEDAKNKLEELKDEDVGMFDKEFGQYAILKTMIKNEVLTVDV